MAVVTAFESAPTNPPYPQLPFIGPPLYSLYDSMGPEPNVSREQLLALELDDARRAELRMQFSRIAAMAGPLLAFPLDDRVEIAGVYKA